MCNFRCQYKMEPMLRWSHLTASRCFRIPCCHFPSTAVVQVHLGESDQLNVSDGLSTKVTAVDKEGEFFSLM